MVIAGALCVVASARETRAPGGSTTTSSSNSRVQFSLRKLLLLVAVIASSLATFGVWGIAITLFVIIQAICIRRAAGERDCAARRDVLGLDNDLRGGVSGSIMRQEVKNAALASQRQPALDAEEAMR